MPVCMHVVDEMSEPYNPELMPLSLLSPLTEVQAISINKRGRIQRPSARQRRRDLTVGLRGRRFDGSKPQSPISMLIEEQLEALEAEVLDANPDLDLGSDASYAPFHVLPDSLWWEAQRWIEELYQQRPNWWETDTIPGHLAA